MEVACPHYVVRGTCRTHYLTKIIIVIIIITIIIIVTDLSIES